MTIVAARLRPQEPPKPLSQGRFAKEDSTTRHDTSQRKHFGLAGRGDDSYAHKQSGFAFVPSGTQNRSVERRSGHNFALRAEWDNVQRFPETSCYFGNSDAKSGCGRAITSAMISFPPRRSTVALPVSIAVWTAATSPRTMMVM